MFLAVDVDYRDGHANVAGVAFSDWGDSTPSAIYLEQLPEPQPYKPGEFYRRELPCILALLKTHQLHPSTIIVDGHVFLSDESEAGLGKHLFDELGGTVAVVGVAKNVFRSSSIQTEVFRGSSSRPLYVTSAGMPIDEACRGVVSMHGKNRLPTLIKLADRKARSS